jgi:hypothetical protein
MTKIIATPDRIFAKGAGTSRTEAVDLLLAKAKAAVLDGTCPDGVVVSACIGREVCGTDGLNMCSACEVYDVDEQGVATRQHRA